MQKRWHAIIERGLSWSLTAQGWQGKRQLEMMSTSGRKFSKVAIQALNRWDNRTLEVFAQHGANIRQLELSNCILNNRAICCQVLAAMPMLEKIVLEGVGLNLRAREWHRTDSTGRLAAKTLEDLNADDWPTSQDLAKLTTLEVSHTSYELLKFFEKSQLKSLKLTIAGDIEDLQQLLNFLATQNGLEEAVIETTGFAESKLFQTAIPANFIPFKLKQLSLVDVNLLKTPNYYNNLKAFVRMHVATLKVLELRGCFPQSFLEFVLANFKKMETLRLIDFDLRRIKEDYESVKSLHLCNVYTNAHLDHGNMYLKTMMVHYMPNLETLTMDKVDGYFLRSAIISLKKLQKLTVKSFDVNGCDGNIWLRRLESLNIGQIEGPFGWNRFTLNNSGITALSIKKLHTPENLNLKKITQNLKNLRELTIEDENLKCDDDFFNIIREHCKNLELLHLNAKSLIVDMSSVADIRGLSFRQF